MSLSLPKEDNACDVSECLNKYSEDSEDNDNDSMPTCFQCRVKRKSVKSIRIVKSASILMIHFRRFGVDGNTSNNVIINENIGINSSHYVLYAWVCHHGMHSMSGHMSGHNTSYCKLNSSSLVSSLQLHKH